MVGDAEREMVGVLKEEGKIEANPKMAPLMFGSVFLLVNCSDFPSCMFSPHFLLTILSISIWAEMYSKLLW
jgi:hypothetical protein